jgi:hypothetical protein
MSPAYTNVGLSNLALQGLFPSYRSFASLRKKMLYCPDVDVDNKYIAIPALWPICPEITKHVRRITWAQIDWLT